VILNTFNQGRIRHSSIKHLQLLDHLSIQNYFEIVLTS